MRLATERLILRPWEERDRAPLAAIMGDAQVRRFFPGRLTREETDRQMDWAIERQESDGFCFQAAELKADGSLAGWIGIGVIPDATREAIPGHPRVEIGWVFAECCWGQGLAPEGARAWLDYAWQIGLPEVVAFTAAINRPSRRVMEKIGMQRDPAADFAHPKVAEGHPLRPHVLYRIANPVSRQ